uniref:copper chaperone n=1 Tax=Halomonas sp. TaxID=1486246 RepID=UPI0025C52608
AFCLGCCWALMLVMVIVGIANLAWMAPLAALMLYEKVGRHGARLARPVGGLLILLGLLVMVDPAWLPSLVSDHGLHASHGHGSH